MIKRITVLIVAFLLLKCNLPVAFAQVFPSVSSEGSIKIYMEWEDEKLDDGALNAYRVCDIVKKNGEFLFEPVEDLKKYNLNLNDMIQPQQANEFVKLAKKEKLRKFTAPIENGEAFFGNLPIGLYVVTQEAHEATDGFEPISAFLISVPTFENGGYNLHVAAYPKVSLEPEETEPPESKPTEPTKPDDPKLPQSGQLNWPVPVLAVSGLLLMVIGGLILSDGRKENHEK